MAVGDEAATNENENLFLRIHGSKWQSNTRVGEAAVDKASIVLHSSLHEFILCVLVAPNVHRILVGAVHSAPALSQTIASKENNL